MKFKQRIGCIVVGVSLLVMLVALYKVRSRKLLDGCTPALVLQNDRDISTSYWWLSDSVALLCRSPYDRSSPPAVQGRFSLYNRVTHTETPLAELTAALNKNRIPGFEVTVSADKRWVLWQKQKWTLPGMGDAQTSPPRYEILTAPPAIGAEGGADYDRQFVIKARTFANAQSAVQTFRFDLPEHGGIEGTVISRSGDRIACFMGHAPPLPEIFSLLGSGNDASVGLWVSDIDGSHMRELGYVRCPARDYYNNGSPWDAVDLSNLQWLPDGKHLSFVRANTLYVMPCE